MANGDGIERGLRDQAQMVSALRWLADELEAGRADGNITIEYETEPVLELEPKPRWRLDRRGCTVRVEMHAMQQPIEPIREDKCETTGCRGTAVSGSRYCPPCRSIRSGHGL